MIVYENDGGRVELQGTLDNLARIKRHMVDSAPLLGFVGDQGIVVVEKQYIELLVHLMRELRFAIIQQGVPSRDHRLLDNMIAERAQRDGLGQFQRMYDGVARAFHFAQGSQLRRHNGADAAKAVTETLCQRLCIAARQGAEQQQFDQFVIGEAICTRFSEALPKALPMAKIMRFSDTGRFSLSRWRVQA